MVLFPIIGAYVCKFSKEIGQLKVLVQPIMNLMSDFESRSIEECAKY